MNIVLLFLLVSHLILPGAPQEQKTVAELVADLVENQEVLINKIYREADADKAQATKLANKVDHVLLDLDKAFAVIEILVELTNGTSQLNITLLQKDTEILKGRLAIAAIFSSVYMIISTLWLIGQLAVLVKKSVKKHQLKRHEEEVELMDQKLQERRERRRAAAKARSGSPRQQ